MDYFEWSDDSMVMISLLVYKQYPAETRITEALFMSAD